MIAESLLPVDIGRPCCCSDFWRANLVGNAPANVFGPSLTAIGPPCIGFQLGVQFAKHIDKADFVEYLGQPFALFRQKTRILAVAAPVFEVDFLVCNVSVATQNKFTFIAAQ